MSRDSPAGVESLCTLPDDPLTIFRFLERLGEGYPVLFAARHSHNHPRCFGQVLWIRAQGRAFADRGHGRNQDHSNGSRGGQH